LDIAFDDHSSPTSVKNGLRRYELSLLKGLSSIPAQSNSAAQKPKPAVIDFYPKSVSNPIFAAELNFAKSVPCDEQVKAG